MLCLEDDAREEVLLDIGCGSGLSGETLTRHGYRAWVGIDASAAMLERATRGRSAPKRTADEKERRGNIEDPPARGAVLRGDFSQGLPFRAGAFDGCVSVSAARWLCAGTESEDEAGNENDETLRRFFARLRFALRPGARAALQVYPKTVRETAAFEAAIRRVEHLTGVAVVAFPHENKSKKLFVCARRDDDDEEHARASGKQTGTRSPPRCLLAWPHAAACEAAWHDYVTNAEGETERSTHAMKRATRARSDREHVAAQRRARCGRCGARVAACTRRAWKTPGPAARASLVLVSGCWRRSTPRVPAARSPRRSTRRRTSRATGACVRARASASSRARGSGSSPGAARRNRNEPTANEPTTREPANVLAFGALAAFDGVGLAASRRDDVISRSSRVLLAFGGVPGVCPGDAVRRLRRLRGGGRGANATRERAVRGEEDSRTDSDSAHQENAGVAVLSRARARSARVLERRGLGGVRLGPVEVERRRGRRRRRAGKRSVAGVGFVVALARRRGYVRGTPRRVPRDERVRRERSRRVFRRFVLKGLFDGSVVRVFPRWGSTTSARERIGITEKVVSSLSLLVVERRNRERVIRRARRARAPAATAD